LTDKGKIIMGTARKNDGPALTPALYPEAHFPSSTGAIERFSTVAKPELGTKRICPETGRKFYDLNRDPIVSPYTGKTYPLSYFEDTTSSSSSSSPVDDEEQEDAAVEESEEDTSDADTVSLEEADEDEGGKNENLPDVDDDDEVEIDDDDDDTFLPDDEDDDDDDMSDLIGDVNDGEEES
jgi:uncharacterized protein (TIGR02300 family)